MFYHCVQHQTEMQFAHMPQLQHKQTNSKHPRGQWQVYLEKAVYKMAISLKTASGACSQHNFCAKAPGMLLSSFLQTIVSIAIGHGSGWVSYSFSPARKHFLCLSLSLPLPHSIHCECQVTKCQHLCHSGLRKSPGACCNPNHSGDAWSLLCWVKCLKENTSQEGENQLFPQPFICVWMIEWERSSVPSEQY